MGKIFRTGCFSKGVCKEYMELFRILEVKEASIALEQEKEKKTSKYNTVYKFRYLAMDIQTDETHTMKFGLISWGIHSEIAQ
jgi:hypothetical protein